MKKENEVGDPDIDFEVLFLVFQIENDIVGDSVIDFEVLFLVFQIENDIVFFFFFFPLIHFIHLTIVKLIDLPHRILIIKFCLCL